MHQPGWEEEIKEIIGKLRTRLHMKRENDKFTFCGKEIAVTERGILVNQAKAVDAMENLDFVGDPEREIAEEERSEYRSVVGKLMWLQGQSSRRQKWALLPNCPLLGTKKWHFECPNKNSESTFISQTSPKNDGIDFSFMRLPLLDGFLAISKYAKLRKLFQKGCLGPK